MKKFSEFHQVLEKDEHKKSAEYKKLTPKMKKAVDDVFTTLESNPSNFMSSNITNALINKEKNRKALRYGQIRGHLKSKYSFSIFISLNL